jgi:organic radical activating enzyme
METLFPHENEADRLKRLSGVLDSYSPSFCLAKWLQVTLHLQNGQTHSCHHPRTHTIPLEEVKANPSALHNTTHKKKQRQMMLEGERPEECSYCWNIEDASADNYSDRHFKSFSDWAWPKRESVATSSAQENINPSYLEVSFGHECNFKCSYCSPQVSSPIMAELKKHGPYDVGEEGYDLEWLESENLMPRESEGNPYVEAFWKWWPDLYPDLEVLRITGGEPLINTNTFKVLDYVSKNPRQDLELALNSNLGIKDHFLDRFIERAKELLEGQKVKRLLFFTSVDTFGEQAEYIRNGLDFEQFSKNLEKVLEQVPQLSVTLMCTFNALSVPGFQKFLDWFLELRQKWQTPGWERLILDVSYLHFPSYQAVKILPSHFERDLKSLVTFMKERQKEYGEEKNGFLHQEVERVARIEAWMKTPTDKTWQEQARKNFYRFFKEHDRRRGTNFLKTFPELRDFWKICEQMVVQ